MSPLPAVARNARVVRREKAAEAGYRAGRFARRATVPVAVVGGVGGAGYLAARHVQKGQTVELIDPFSKGIESPKVRIIHALVPTGRHVGSANSLVHVHNSRGGGGKATDLERYRGHGTKLGRKMAGPIHKAAKAGLYRTKGLQMVAHQSAPTRVPQTGRTAGRVRQVQAMRRNDVFPEHEFRQGSMDILRGKVTKGIQFQNGMSTGRRIA